MVYLSSVVVVAWVVCLLVVLVFVHVTIAGSVVLVVPVDVVFVVVFVCCVAVPLLVYVPVAFGGIVLIDECAVHVVFVDCVVVDAALFDHVIVGSVGSNAHALMTADHNFLVVVVVLVVFLSD